MPSGESGDGPDAAADGPRIAVWHRDDLRVRDNAALAAAARDGRPVPAFVFDPAFYRSGMACDARLRFCHESVAGLAAAYRRRGGGLALRRGDPVEVLASLPVDRVYVNRSATARYGRERDRGILAWSGEDRPEVRAFADDGLDWTDRPRSAYDWRANAEAYFEGTPSPAPDSLPPNPVPSTTSVEAVERRYDTDPEKAGVPTGGPSAARERLGEFLDGLAEYTGGIAPPKAAEERTSRLSPYLAFGCLSPRQAYRRAHAAAEDRQDGRVRRGLDAFVSRLYWNRHYSQKVVDWPGWTDRTLNPVYRGLFREDHDPDLAAAWKRGETGFPLVDAAMRALRETGWINFRTRALCATFYTLVLRCYWRAGADWFYRHLVDADPGINYTQWQSQTNLTGVHPLRVYDPAKQLREYDPDGEYVYEYVPELRGLPPEHLPRPEKAPLAVQAECGVCVGEDYPRPVVDFERRRIEVRERFGDWADRAAEAAEDPDVRRRGSFSQRGRRSGDDPGDDGGGDAGEGQASLSEF
jgi:deoxyribodipyrimidine photo-lyase